MRMTGFWLLLAVLALVAVDGYQRAREQRPAPKSQELNPPFDRDQDCPPGPRHGIGFPPCS